MTHWSVNDQVAAFLVADTLRRMKENPNLGIAGALRNAQLAMLADAGKGLPAEIAHPFFWAPFAVIGEGGERGPATAERHVSPQSRWPVYKLRRDAETESGMETIETLGKYEIKRTAWPRCDGHRVRGLGPDHRAPRGDQDRAPARLPPIRKPRRRWPASAARRRPPAG